MLFSIFRIIVSTITINKTKVPPLLQGAFIIINIRNFSIFDKKWSYFNRTVDTYLLQKSPIKIVLLTYFNLKVRFNDALLNFYYYILLLYFRDLIDTARLILQEKEAFYKRVTRKIFARICKHR